MPGDWIYDELLPIGRYELTILSTADAFRLNSHWSFPLVSSAMRGFFGSGEQDA